jgi:hypothetical protein
MQNIGDPSPVMLLQEDRLEFGPGSSIPDTWIHRTGAGAFEVRYDLVPTADLAGHLGYGVPSGGTGLRWGELHVHNAYIDILTLTGNFVPATDDALDLGSATYRWRNLYLAGFLHVSAGLTPDANNSYDIGSPSYGWRNLYLSGAIMELTGGCQVNFLPNADATYDLGSVNFRWAHLWVAGWGSFGNINVGNYTVITSARVLQNVTSVTFLPDADSTYDLGSGSVRWGNIYVAGVGSFGWLNVAGYTVISSSRVLENVTAAASIITSGQFALALVPSVDGMYDLGALSARWCNIYCAGFGSFLTLDINGLNVITDSRVLQNVTANASIITSGKFALGQLPDGTQGYVLEAEGSLDPMYVNPNGRYTPAAHTHAAGDITSGVLAEARCPNVYDGHITFNGGITASSYVSPNGNAGATTGVTVMISSSATAYLTFQGGLLVAVS